SAANSAASSYRSRSCAGSWISSMPASPLRTHAATSSLGDASAAAAELSARRISDPRDLDAPYLRPLLQVGPAELAGALRLELIPRRDRSVVVHQHERLSRRERCEGLEDRRVLPARSNDAYVELHGSSLGLIHRRDPLDWGRSASPRGSAVDRISRSADEYSYNARPIVADGMLEAELLQPREQELRDALVHLHERAASGQLLQRCQCANHRLRWIEVAYVEHADSRILARL